MQKLIRKTEGLVFNNFLYDLPCPSTINYFWNFGSLLGVFLVNQILSGLFLTMNYISSSDFSFLSMVDVEYFVSNGWLIRSVHVNGASFFLMLMFMHIGRGLFYESYLYAKVWMVGVTILLLSMGVAFLGYVLPWGQMSYWGATVITGLLSAIPYVGPDMMVWLWGDFCLSTVSLCRFYTFHFVLPFVVLILSMIHLIFLHSQGSSNPLGLTKDLDKVSFFPYFFLKDFLGFLVVYILFMYFCLWNPFILMDSENFLKANTMVTPVHIQPEWYFLFAYAILRSIPSKLGGVLALFLSIGVFYFIPVVMSKDVKGCNYLFLNKLVLWFFVHIFFLLTWIGASVVEFPFVSVGQVLSVAYFLYFGFNAVTKFFFVFFLK